MDSPYSSMNRDNLLARLENLEAELAVAMARNRQLNENLNSVQARCTELTMQCRGLVAMANIQTLDGGQTLAEQVREFMKLIDQPVLDKPQVPPDSRIRLRLRLIAEEFWETVEACLGALDWANIAYLKRETLRVIGDIPRFNVDLPAFIDGLADLDYVVEGARAETGVDGTPIAAAVHAANLTKANGPIDENGKRLKPPGFTPPDIAGCLRAQGWCESGY